MNSDPSKVNEEATAQARYKSELEELAGKMKGKDGDERVREATRFYETEKAAFKNSGSDMPKTWEHYLLYTTGELAKAEDPTKRVETLNLFEVIKNYNEHRTSAPRHTAAPAPAPEGWQDYFDSKLSEMEQALMDGNIEHMEKYIDQKLDPLVEQFGKFDPEGMKKTITDGLKGFEEKQKKRDEGQDKILTEIGENISKYESKLGDLEKDMASKGDIEALRVKLETTENLYKQLKDDYDAQQEERKGEKESYEKDMTGLRTEIEKLHGLLSSLTDEATPPGEKSPEGPYQQPQPQEATPPKPDEGGGTAAEAKPKPEPEPKPEEKPAGEEKGYDATDEIKYIEDEMSEDDLLMSADEAEYLSTIEPTEEVSDKYVEEKPEFKIIEKDAQTRFDQFRRMLRKHDEKNDTLTDLRENYLIEANKALEEGDLDYAHKLSLTGMKELFAYEKKLAEEKAFEPKKEPEKKEPKPKEKIIKYVEAEPEKKPVEEEKPSGWARFKSWFTPKKKEEAKKSDVARIPLKRSRFKSTVNRYIVSRGVPKSEIGKSISYETDGWGRVTAVFVDEDSEYYDKVRISSFDMGNGPVAEGVSDVADGEIEMQVPAYLTGVWRDSREKSAKKKAMKERIKKRKLKVKAEKERIKKEKPEAEEKKPGFLKSLFTRKKKRARVYDPEAYPRPPKKREEWPEPIRLEEPVEEKPVGEELPEGFEEVTEAANVVRYEGDDLKALFGTKKMHVSTARRAIEENLGKDYDKNIVVRGIGKELISVDVPMGTPAARKIETKLRGEQAAEVPDEIILPGIGIMRKKEVKSPDVEEAGEGLPHDIVAEIEQLEAAAELPDAIDLKIDIIPEDKIATVQDAIKGTEEAIEILKGKGKAEPKVAEKPVEDEVMIDTREPIKGPAKGKIEAEDEVLSKKKVSIDKGSVIVKSTIDGEEIGEKTSGATITAKDGKASFKAGYDGEDANEKFDEVKSILEHGGLKLHKESEAFGDGFAISAKGTYKKKDEESVRHALEGAKAVVERGVKEGASFVDTEDSDIPSEEPAEEDGFKVLGSISKEKGSKEEIPEELEDYSFVDAFKEEDEDGKK